MKYSEIAEMLSVLPQACVQDVVKAMKNSVSVNMAHFVLRQIETMDLIKWKRETPPCIEITVKGQKFMEQYRAK